MEHRSHRTFSEPPKRGGLKDADVGERVTSAGSAVSTLPAGVAFLVRKEVVELYTHRMGTPDGEWAAAELREIKARRS